MKNKDTENQIEFYKTPEPLEEYEKFSVSVTLGEYFYYRPNPTGKFKNNESNLLSLS